MTLVSEKVQINRGRPTAPPRELAEPRHSPDCDAAMRATLGASAFAIGAHAFSSTPTCPEYPSPYGVYTLYRHSGRRAAPTPAT